jgi:hypothetical protein
VTFLPARFSVTSSGISIIFCTTMAAINLT